VTKKIFFFLMVVILVALVAFLVWFGFLRKGKAALLVETLPRSQVYVDGELVGKTPYEAELAQKEVVVKLVPESFEKPLVPYETKILLTSGVKTIVRRVLGEGEEESYGEEVSFEKLGGKITSVAVVTEPDGAQVYIDGNFKDIAPLKINDVNPGVYQVTARAEGYVERTFSVQVMAGYGVTAIVDLEKSEKVENGNKNEQEDHSPTEVVILETPTGFLRVREEPSTSAAEIGQVKPDENYKIIEKSEDGDWYKIEIGEEKEGWISSEYASVSAESSS
jgi:hypothetical protein